MRRCLLVLLLASLVGAREPTSLEKLPEQGFLYHPRARTGRAPFYVEELTLRASDGVRLNAWWLKGTPTLLYFHGNGGNLEYSAHILEECRALGWGALALDYRGFGSSEGYPSEAGLYRDARAAYQACLDRGVRPQQLLIHGQSLGGAVATHLALERACAGLIVESTFTTMPAMARRIYGVVAATALVSQYPTVRVIGKLKVPVLVIHGAADDFIPPTMGKKLFATAPEPKWLWLVPGAHHNNLRTVAGAQFGLHLLEFWGRCQR